MRPTLPYLALQHVTFHVGRDVVGSVQNAPLQDALAEIVGPVGDAHELDQGPSIGVDAVGLEALRLNPFDDVDGMLARERQVDAAEGDELDGRVEVHDHEVDGAGVPVPREAVVARQHLVGVAAHPGQDALEVRPDDRGVSPVQRRLHPREDVDIVEPERRLHVQEQPTHRVGHAIGVLFHLVILPAKALIWLSQGAAQRGEEELAGLVLDRSTRPIPPLVETDGVSADGLQQGEPVIRADAGLADLVLVQFHCQGSYVRRKPVDEVNGVGSAQRLALEQGGAL
ncbi:hypothetical protein PG996_011035 [Apiospora saccharicola]|uniref:Uncharacterized protein n=1 Tax=Apiospora saccharicola TaxID=335842 RepID=A0ABR1UDW6_9PEZI